jgi:hypothetical protein
MIFLKSSAGFLLLTWLLTSGPSSVAQVYPPEGAVLTATRVPLQTEVHEGASFYRFKLAKGHITGENLTDNDTLLTAASSGNKTVVQLPLFEQEYSWQVDYYNPNGKKLASGPVARFKLSANGYADTSRYRLRVIEDNYPVKDLYFFVDNIGCLYNLKGQPVWFAPQLVNDPSAGIQGSISNVSLSPTASLTFIAGQIAMEAGYDGRVKWIPKPDAKSGRILQPHHEFVKNADGTFMFLDWKEELVKFNLPDIPPAARSASPEFLVKFGVLNQFDSDGNLIWSWSSSEYFTAADLVDYVNYEPRPRPSTHMNAFYFDEKNKVIYIGVKDVSRIIKLSYPDKKVIGVYNGFAPDSRNNSFREQHGITAGPDGSFYVYSNNTARSRSFPGPIPGEKIDSGIVSSVVRLKFNNKGGVDKLWEFICDIDTQAPAASSRGGNVVLLPDGNLFVFMGSASRVFIVTPGKKILYNAVVEINNMGSDTWSPLPSYRAFPITQKALDDLIIQSGSRY